MSAAHRGVLVLTRRYLRSSWLPAHAGETSMPLTWALSLTVTNWMVIAPALLAVAVNDSATPLNSPPAVAKMSKLVSTWVPLMRTLNVLEPAAVQDRFVTNDVSARAPAHYATTDDMPTEHPDLAPWRPSADIEPRLSDAGLVSLATMQAISWQPNASANAQNRTPR